MYRIEHLPALRAAPIGMRSMHARGAIDEERGLIVRHIGRYRETECTAWLLQRGDALVPFDVGERFTSEGGRSTVVLNLESFGFSTVVAQRVGILRYAFSSQEQEEEWATFAVEGVVVDWRHQFTPEQLSLRMEALGRSWTNQDFGYAEEA
jgi:hypothetical protein